MSKKNHKQGKQVNTLYNYFKKNNNLDKNILQAILKAQSKKKMAPKTLEQPVIEEKSISNQILIRKNHIFSLAKDVQVQEILLKCPKLEKIANNIEEAVSIRKSSVRQILKKYIQANSYALWTDKYSPQSCSELFNIKAGEKIKDWLHAFFEYKNKIREVSDPFLEDFQQPKSSKIRKKILQNRWKLEALVVRGRPGIGKTSAIMAIAQQIQIDMLYCGNHYNQTKYLKEKNESTQSQSVKTAITRKLKLQKNAQMITKYLSPVDREKISQSRKCQLIHNIGAIYPQSQVSKFYAELNRCIDCSKIPFIMTDSCSKLPNQCISYDVIDYDVGQKRDIQEIMWIIYHIENILKINTIRVIERQALFDEINQQIEPIQYEETATLSKMKEICCLFNYQLDKILTYLESNKHLERVNSYGLVLDKCSKFTKDSFLQSIPYFYEQLLDQNYYQPLSSFSIATQSILNIEASLTQASQQDETTKVNLWLQYFQMLNLKQVTDIISGQNGEKNIFKMEGQQQYQQFIQTDVHRSVKKSLAKKVNKQINVSSEKNKSTLRASQLQFLPMLIQKNLLSCKPKTNRECYEDYFNQNQSLYIKRYGHLIKKQ